MFSLVVPAYNEGEHIFENLKEIESVIASFAGKYAVSKDFEIIPVNDGSSDNTESEILRAQNELTHVRAVSYAVNRGKGGAIVEGVRNAKGDYIGFLDADLDLPADLYDSFLYEADTNGYDVIIGSKMHKDSKLEYPFARKVFSVGYFVLLKILFGLGVKDTQTGIKLYKADLIRKIAPELRTKGYAFDVEIIALAAYCGASVKEMPIRLEYRRETSFGRIKFSDIWKMFTDTISVWWNLRVRKNVYNIKKNG